MKPQCRTSLHITDRKALLGKERGREQGREEEGEGGGKSKRRGGETREEEGRKGEGRREERGKEKGGKGRGGKRKEGKGKRFGFFTFNLQNSEHHIPILLPINTI